MIYIDNYYTWAAVEYHLLHYLLKQYDIQKQRKKDQISNKELDYLEIYKWDNMIKKSYVSIDIPNIMKTRKCGNSGLEMSKNC